MELFRYPLALVWLAAGFAILLLFRYKAEESRQAAARVIFGASYDRLASGAPLARRRLRGILFTAAVGLAALAAAGPQWGAELSPVTDLKGNIVIAVDVSLSMGAKDLKPNRLANARLLLGAIAEKFADYRIGVVAFAGDAYVQCPLTTDLDAITYFSSSMTPGMLPSQGTDFSTAIETVLNMLSRYGGQKVMVLVTDGEDHSTGLDTALKGAEEQGLKVFTIGIGSPDGELVPMTDSAGNVMEYKKDKNGKTVVSRMDEGTLIKIASKTGAAYVRYSGPDTAAEEVRSAVSALDMEKIKGKGRSGFKNRYQWPLAVALVLLLIELLLMEKGFLLEFRFRRLPGGTAALAAAMLLSAGAAHAASAAADARKGNSAYKKGDWPKAFEYYERAAAKDPADKRLNFNLGDAYYRLEDYAKAGEAFEQAAASPVTAARAHYNRGNAAFKAGDIPGAIAAYRKALGTDPDDENAKFNLQKALEQKKKNSCSGGGKDDKKDQKKQDKKDDKGGGDGKDKQQQDQQKQKEQDQQREQERKKNEAKEKSRQILEMMKEREKAAAKERQDARQAPGKPQTQNRLEDW